MLNTTLNNEYYETQKRLWNEQKERYNNKDKQSNANISWNTSLNIPTISIKESKILLIEITKLLIDNYKLSL